MYDEKEMVVILKNDYPIEPSGATRADQIARTIGITGIDRQQYQNLFIGIIAYIPYEEWSFLVKLMSFVRNAKFEKPFYEAFASFIKEKFSEAKPVPSTASKAFLRGRSIEFIAESFKDLFDFEWVKETSSVLQQNHPWPYLDLIKLYEPENFLFEMDKILARASEREKDLTTEILNYAPQMIMLFSKEEVALYFEKWEMFISKSKQKEYRMMVQHYLNKEQAVK